MEHGSIPERASIQGLDIKDESCGEIYVRQFQPAFSLPQHSPSRLPMFNSRMVTLALSLLLLWTIPSFAINLPRAVEALARSEGDKALLRRPAAAGFKRSLFSRQNATCSSGQVSVPCDGIDMCCPAGNICHRDDTGALTCLSSATATRTSIIIPSFTPADTTTTEVILSTLSIPSASVPLTATAFGPTLDPSIAKLSGPDGPSSISIFGLPNNAVAVGVPSTLVILASLVIILAQ